jgi:hypothetical protein
LNTLKEAVIKKCIEIFQEKTGQLKDAISIIDESLGSEIKSSAGDKHETGRAKLQVERENLGRQLLDLESKWRFFERAISAKTSRVVSNGALISTDQGSFFIAASLGKLVVGDHPVLVISAEAPLAKVLIGKSSGEKIGFNGMNYLITEIS